MKLHVAAAAGLLMGIVLLFGAGTGERDRVEIARLSEMTWDEFVPQGKEVDAIYGDWVLRNRHLTAVIAEPLPTRNANMTVRSVGGALIDLTVRDSQSDQLSAFYPGRREYPFDAWTAAVDENAPQAMQGDATISGKAGEIVVRAAGGERRPAVEVAYRLEADAPYLTVTTTYTNTASGPLTVELEDDLRADAGKEDMQKSPNGESEWFWIHDRHWGQAYGIDVSRGRIRANSDARNSVLNYVQPDGSDRVALEPGQSFELKRRVYPGRSLLDVRAIAEERRGRRSHPVRFVIRDGNGDPVQHALVEVGQSGAERGATTTDEQGRAVTALPAGDYQATIIALGVRAAGELSFRVGESGTRQDVEFELSDYRPGRVTANITDERGKPIPCKVEFVPAEGTPRPSFGPESAAFGVGNVYYAPLGEFAQSLPAGRYRVIVSHGPEYDAIFTELEVPPGRDVPLQGELVRSVQTPGWISSDFHSHSSPSGDNTGSQLGRVLNLVCEHVEFAPCTEHNRIDTYEPHIEALGVAGFIGTVSGMELTGQPLPLNHQNAFPLKRTPRTQDGGAPVTDTDPERQIERLALWDDRSEKLVQQNHPDIGWLFYDRDGDGRHDNGYERSFMHIDVMEIHPIDTALDLSPVDVRDGRPFGNNRIFNWLQLLNQGFRIPGVVNTDAHYNYHGSGGLRNWIRCSTDDPAQIDPMEIVRESEAGHVIMSNGPFLEVSARETGRQDSVLPGDDLPAPSGRVTLDLRVQCPNWHDVDRVFVLVNGRRHDVHDYTRGEHPDRFRDGAVKFDQELQLELSSDAHVIVVAGGSEPLGPVLGPSWGRAKPTAVSNPVFVDVDGDGFAANKDTLGHALPVKFQTR